MTRRPFPARRPGVEQLEDRTVPSTVTVNVGQAIRTATALDLGVNLTWWDSALNTPQTQQMVQAAGLNFFRFPGGSSADTWHFNVGPTWNGEGTSPSMASFIAALGGTGLVTLNYGTASPQEDAALLAYLNGSTGNTTAIGVGPQWSDASNSWVNVDWKTAGYWAGLRAAAPLAQDDGLNFLRLGRSAPFGIHYFEVGNEIYGSWETDHHATPHDPATYVTFAKQFAAYAAHIDSTIAIGVDGSGTGGSYSQVPGNWTDQVLQQCATQGFTPNFVSDHNYMFDPGNENDANLLLHSATDPNASGYGGPIDWAGRAAAYRSLITKDLGAAGAGVQLLATEFNSVSYNPSNQTTSLVNGLWLADALGGLLETEYAGATVWDLRNGYDTSHDNSSLYGWRTGGDYGLIGSGNGSPPATGTYVPYPTYFAEQLLSKMVHTGDTVVQATSDDATLSAYAVKEQNGHLDLLIINKNQSTNLTGQFNVSGFTPASQATVWQYGEAQDTAQSQTSDGHSSLANFTQTLTVNGGGFSFTAPAYSMTVLDLAPASSGPGLPPGWSDSNIGSPGKAGSASDSGGTWTVSGGGADIWNSSDQFNFAHESLSGDGSVVAKVTSLTNTNAWAKASVMLRNGTAANAVFVDMVVTPGEGVAFQWRASAGAVPGNTNITGISAPVWVKLTRSGNSFAGYYSSDGVTWKQVGSTQTITMPSSIQAGLAVTAHDNSKLATATFTNVAVQAGFTTQLSRAGWVATASSTESGGSPGNALDGNAGTRWSTGAHQAAGQWFQVNLGKAMTFQELVLDTSGSLNDYPRGYAVYVSQTGTDWATLKPVATGKGSGAVTTITLPAAVTGRYVRVVQTGSDPMWWWSIDEFNLYV
ncbi:MAG TPA: discoidin domain-containing protein [Gemmataceae bacterium]|nr:discoidin domain-containing protein [Gemmataceae bacterium]